MDFPLYEVRLDGGRNLGKLCDGTMTIRLYAPNLIGEFLARPAGGAPVSRSHSPELQRVYADSLPALIFMVLTGSRRTQQFGADALAAQEIRLLCS
jgi:hypothetical protein